jgi:3-oxoacyl-(acyl-carrier-protein) synthase
MMRRQVVLILPVLVAVVSLFAAIGVSSANAQSMMGNATGSNMTSMSNATTGGNMTGLENMTNSSSPMMSNST